MQAQQFSSCELRLWQAEGWNKNVLGGEKLKGESMRHSRVNGNELEKYASIYANTVELI